jgi:hypothetical protein
VCNNGTDRVPADEAARRAAGRRRYNAWRRAIALLRRTALARLLHVQGGLARTTRDGWPDRRMGALGNQAALARYFGVSRATICRDLQKLLAEHHPCPTCGAGVRPPGPTPSDEEDSSAFVEACLARHRDDVRQGILGWAGRGPLPGRAQAARSAAAGEVPDASAE